MSRLAPECWGELGLPGLAPGVLRGCIRAGAGTGALGDCHCESQGPRSARLAPGSRGLDLPVLASGVSGAAAAGRPLQLPPVPAPGWGNWCVWSVAGGLP